MKFKEVIMIVRHRLGVSLGLILLLTALCGSVLAQPETIRFDDLPAGFNLANFQHPRVSFVSPPGYSAVVRTHIGTFPPVQGPHLVVSSCDSCTTYSGTLTINFTEPMTDFGIFFAINQGFSSNTRVRFHIYRDPPIVETYTQNFGPAPGWFGFNGSHFGERITRIVIEPDPYAVSEGFAIDTLRFRPMSELEEMESVRYEQIMS